MKPHPEKRFEDNDPAVLAGGGLSHWIAVLPLGATEQHGPHLPAETDTLIAGGIAGRLARALPPSLPVTFLPVEEVGYSPEHLDWPVTQSLGYAQAIERWIAIGGQLNSHGIRKLVLLNAHGGNSALMTIVATELRVRFSMLCVTTAWTRFGYPPDIVPPSLAAIDIHAGMIETSVMLALHPERVDMGKAENFKSSQSALIAENRWLSAYGRHGFGWKMQDLNARGAVGDAAAASAEKGEMILAHAVGGLCELLGEVHRFDLAQLGPVP